VAGLRLGVWSLRNGELVGPAVLLDDDCPDGRLLALFSAKGFAEKDSAVVTYG
jgi:hypothetical protein